MSGRFSYGVAETGRREGKSDSTLLHGVSANHGPCSFGPLEIKYASLGTVGVCRTEGLMLNV